MNKETILPEGWKIDELGKVCNVIMGQSPSSDTYNTEGIGLPFFQGKAEFTELHPVVRKWCDAPNKIAEPNDVLVSVRAPVGATNIANRKCCIGRGLAAIRHPNSKFIFYFLRLNEQELDKKGTGTTFRAISGETLRNINIPIPPPDEQQEIVEKIEELFSELDKGVENLKAAQQQLKVYRQAVLKWAFEGKLTNESVKDGELPEGWKWVSFKEIFAESPQNGIYKSSSEYGNGTPIIRIDGFYEGKVLSDYQYKRVRLSDDEKAKYRIKANDLLINRVNSLPYLGKCGLVTNLKEDTVFESNIMKIKVLQTKALPNYISLYLTSKKGLNELRKNAKHAVNQASINQTDVGNAQIPICSTDEQYGIVQEIESRVSVCDKMEETIIASLQQAEALRQSILKKAFEGRLVGKRHLQTVNS